MNILSKFEFSTVKSTPLQKNFPSPITINNAL